MDRKIALVPAAGSGSRMGEERPKQYLQLAGRPLIFHALRTLCFSPRLERVFTVLAPDDAHWRTYDWGPLGHKLTALYCGGATRAESVLNALGAIEAHVAAEDWVLVHDAARPCLSSVHLEKLIAEVSDDAVGGILAMPISDTIKREGESGRIGATVQRAGLWQAQTPQMFRYGLLRRALEAGCDVTDEASAVEALGESPRLIGSDMTNFKVTYPQDLELAELILAERGEA